MRFVCDPCQVEVTIYEEHNSPNQIKIPKGILSENSVKAIAYKLLSMVEHP